MTIPGPDSEGTPDGSDATPSLTEEVWLKFLADNERAIHASAPREPSAAERASSRHPRRLGPDRTDRRCPGPHDAPADAVGDLWQQDGPPPPWRDLDGPARLRRIGRVIATVAAIGVAVGAWSLLSTTAGTPGEQQDVSTVQELEKLPDAVPTANPARPGSTAAESAVPIG
ncbi:hypothetical protein ACFU3E_30295 [Streptomyces sp. NPDC057424]|uniref:hypothetical protein n=1 Tax=Streptomyces sp. NPDC057424 TaxID=3346127 RepID=UPI00367939F5